MNEAVQQLNLRVLQMLLQWDIDTQKILMASSALVGFFSMSPFETRLRLKAEVRIPTTPNFNAGQLCLGAAQPFTTQSALMAPCVDLIRTKSSRHNSKTDSSSQRLGSTGSVLFLEQIDGELQSDLATRVNGKAIRQLRPDAILATTLGGDTGCTQTDMRSIGYRRHVASPLFFQSMPSSPRPAFASLKPRSPIMRRRLWASAKSAALGTPDPVLPSPDEDPLTASKSGFESELNKSS